MKGKNCTGSRCFCETATKMLRTQKVACDVSDFVKQRFLSSDVRDSNVVPDVTNTTVLNQSSPIADDASDVEIDDASSLSS